MSASATFTIVMSSNRMKTPRQTAASVHHFGSRPVLVAGAGSAICVVMSSPLSAGFVNSRIITCLTITFGTILSSEHSSSA